MNIESYIQKLSARLVDEVNEIHRDYLDLEEDDGHSVGLHGILWDSIVEFVNENFGLLPPEHYTEEYREDEIEIILVATNYGWLPSVRTSNWDAPASTIDPALAVPTSRAAFKWGFADAVIAHVLEQGISRKSA